jgi:hypothetical protein
MAIETKTESLDATGAGALDLVMVPLRITVDHGSIVQQMQEQAPINGEGHANAAHAQESRGYVFFKCPLGDRTG